MQEAGQGGVGLSPGAPSLGRCAAHEELPAIVRCACCDRELCEECWSQRVDLQPACDACALLLIRPIAPVIPVLGAVLAILVLWQVSSRLLAREDQRWIAMAVGSALAVITATRGTIRLNRRRRARSLIRRAASEPAPFAPQGHPYRGALRRSFRRLAPPLSGSLTAFVVGSALVLAATLVPRVLVLPPWVEVELVLGVWWLIWTTSLSVLLYRGWRVARDR